MTKNNIEPKWIMRLRAAMNESGLNPRSLSLKAGLNPTAIRDMLEGRVKFPRYDTVQALAHTLGLTPIELMNGEKQETIPTPKAEKEKPTPSTKTKQRPLTAIDEEEDLDLLSEIIMRLQETAEEYRHTMEPKDFAVMVTTIYRQIRPMENKPDQQDAKTNLLPKIKDLITYDRLRRRVS